ncbi:matrin 3-like 1.2 isoform X2 [Amia ocellicauda]|uniref:matrin 3-like 1.2 isoform X2 n=1 Tax=Amia ocellicauda TaxID=2972642 RepID=UPI003463E943
MSQKNPSDSAHKGFTAGRGLLAAAESLNFSMSEQRSRSFYPSTSRPCNSMMSPLGGDNKGQDCYPSQHPGNIDNAMKLFVSLGLSPKDLDALAQIPEDNISVETLPHLIMQLKTRKGQGNRRVNETRDFPPLLPDPPYRASRDDWDDMRHVRPTSSLGESSGRSQGVDYSYGQVQESQSRGFDRLDYSEGGGRDRRYSDLSHDNYGLDSLRMGPPRASESLLMQKRVGSPSPGKVRDFHGEMPVMFPHVCSLCDFDVHSNMEWTQHINGLRHAESRRQLLKMYPDWDPQGRRNRVPDSLLLETTNRADGILGPVPLVPGLQRGGMGSSWGSGGGISHQVDTSLSVKPKQTDTRVIAAKFERNAVSMNNLIMMAQPFGTVCQHLMLQNKAFLEMMTHEEAMSLVNFYQHKPATFHGKIINFHLSSEMVMNEQKRRAGKGKDSPVIYFSNLPKGKKSELLSAAYRFGEVEKYLFLNEQAFVQMKNADDAKMMVKYYTINPLHFKGRTVRLNICTKYRNLTVNNKASSGKSERSSASSTNVGGLSRKSQTTTKDKASRDAKQEEAAVEKGKTALEEDSGEEGSGEMEGGSNGEGVLVEEADDGREDDPEPLVDPELKSKPQEEGMELDVGSAGVKGEEASAEEEPVQDSAAEETLEETKQSPGVEIKGEPLENPIQSPQAAEEPSESAEGPMEEPEVKDEEEEEEEEGGEDRRGGGEEGEGEGEEDEEAMLEEDFPENMEDFVTLDELPEEDSSEISQLVPESELSGSSSRDSKREALGRKVVNVVGFKRGYNFLEEILTLAKPFGKVVQHLVLDTRHEAFLELATHEEAKAMVDFYNTNVTATVCGKPVNIHLSQTYKTIQFRAKASGRVIYVGQIPFCRYTDASLLKIAQPYGRVRRYFLNRYRNECFIEMEYSEDAEKMAKAYKENPPKFRGKWLTVYVSKKYKVLKQGRKPPPPEPEEERKPKRGRTESTKSEDDVSEDSPSAGKSKEDEQPSLKKLCVREENSSPEETDSKEQQGESALKSSEPGQAAAVQSDDPEKEKTSESPDTSAVQKSVPAEEPSSSEGTEAVSSNGVSDVVCVKEESPKTKPQPEKKPEQAPFTLGPYQPDNPVGVEYVKMGYYCRVCFLFYSNEETAKKAHCSSLTHYQKLKKHLEKERASSSQ